MINIVGDLNFADSFFNIGVGIGSYIKGGGDPFSFLQRDSDDFWIGNCECVISDVSNKKGLHTEPFRISPGHLEHIQHFNLYGVANNHVMQHGNVAYQDMIRYFTEKQVLYVGCKMQKSLIFEHQNKRVGILAFSQRDEKYTTNPEYWYRPKYKDIEKNIEDLKAQKVDYLICSIHWGNEFINYPYCDQMDFAQWLVDIGVDIVVGMHSHTLQGYEIYHGKPIFYSLGNFLFDMSTSDQCHSSVVHIDLSGVEAKVSTSYVKIGANGLPRVVHSNSIKLEYQFEYLNQLVQDANRVDNETYYYKVINNTHAYRKRNIINIIKRIPKLPFSTIKYIFCDFVQRRIFKK